jgi:branched-chain amino acid transport system permease protein
LQEALSAISLGSIYLLFALGMSLTWGTIDVLNFAHGSIFMFSTFAASLVLTSVSLPFVAVVAIGVVVGAAMSVLIQILAFEPILKRARTKRSAEMQILIGGIGVATIPLAIAQEQTASNPFGLTGSTFQVTVAEVGGLRISNIAVITIIVGLCLWAAVALALRRSRQGLALRSIGVDAETASLMGINRRRLALATMAASGAMAGLAGVLFTYTLGAITPDSGDILLIKAFAVIILGGVGSMAGVAFGAFALAAAETYVLANTNGSWTDAIDFGLIFLVLLARPAGVFGRKEVHRA